MRTKRRGAVVAALAAAAALALGACGSSSDTGSTTSGSPAASGDGSPVTLSMLVPSYSDGTKALWEGIIAGFKAKNPNITINLEVQSWDNINDVVRTKVQSGKQPDILNIDAYAQFAEDGLLFRADEVMSPETIADIQPSFVSNASLDGVQYGIPLIASTRALFYNEDLFAKAGVAAAPKTWDEMLDAAKKISALGGGVYGYGMPLGNEEAQAETSVWLFGAGGTWESDGKITVDTPQANEALTFMQGMVNAKATQPDAGATDRTPLLNVFIQGKLGMAVGLPPTIGQIAEKNPALKYKTTAIPTKDGSPVTLGVADHLMAFKTDDANKQAAIKAFLDYFYQVDTYLKFVDTEGFLPVTKSGAEKTANKEKFAAFLSALPNAKFYPSNNKAWPATQGALQTLVGQIAQGTSPADVLKQIQAKADAGS